MPFDGSGNFSRSYNWVADRDNGIHILASRMDGEFDNFAAGMNLVFFRNGLVPMSGNLAMGSNAITGLGSGSAASPSIRFTDDPNSGLFLNGTSDVRVTVGGTARISITAAGLSVIGALSTTGNTTVGGTLGVTGATTLSSVNNTGNATIGGTLNVTGNATFASSLTTIGDGTTDPQLKFAGTATAGGKIIFNRSGSPHFFVGDTRSALGSGTGGILYTYSNDPIAAYVNATKRLEITNAGVDVTGTFTASGLGTFNDGLTASKSASAASLTLANPTTGAPYIDFGGGGTLKRTAAGSMEQEITTAFASIATIVPATGSIYQRVGGTNVLTVATGSVGVTGTFAVSGATTLSSVLNANVSGVMAAFNTGSATDGRIEFKYNGARVGLIGIDSWGYQLGVDNGKELRIYQNGVLKGTWTNNGLTINTITAIGGQAEVLRLYDATPYMTFYNAAQSDRFGYLQHTGIGGNLILANEETGPVIINAGGTNTLSITSLGATLTGSLTLTGNLDVTGSSTFRSSPVIAGATPFLQMWNAAIDNRFGYILHSGVGAAMTIAQEEANSLNFEVNGSARLSIGSTGNALFTGNVGIGISPTDTLTVYGASGSTAVRWQDSTNGTLGFVASASGIMSGAPANNLGIRAENGLIFSGGGNAQHAAISSSGVLSYGGIEVGYRSIPRSTTTTTAAIGDRGKCIAASAGITIPNATFAAGDSFSIYNDSASSITITQGASLTLRQGGTANTGNRTLAARGLATIWFNTSSEAIISGSGVS